jgi:TLC domain
VNTWLLIARRMLPSVVLDVLFYFTWIVIRVIWFPYLIYDFYLEYRHAANQSGNPLHPIIFAPLIQVGLCFLNAQWTVQLFRSKMSRKHKSHHL